MMYGLYGVYSMLFGSIGKYYLLLMSALMLDESRVPRELCNNKIQCTSDT